MLNIKHLKLACQKRGSKINSGTERGGCNKRLSRVISCRPAELEGEVADVPREWDKLVQSC